MLCIACVQIQTFRCQLLLLAKALSQMLTLFNQLLFRLALYQYEVFPLKLNLQATELFTLKTKS
jgi:hypothetical protein